MSRRIAAGPLDGDLPSDTWEPTMGTLFLYCTGFCYVGFFLAIPLRKRFVLQEPLTFPYAVAAAKTINSLHGADGAAGAGGMLLRGLVPAFAWGMLTWCVDGLERLPLFGNHLNAKYTWRLNLSAAPFGQGFIVPARFILSQAVGAFMAFGIFLPVAIAHSGDWYKESATGFNGSAAYTTIPAIFVIAFDSVYQLTKLFATLFLMPVWRQRSQLTTDDTEELIEQQGQLDLPASTNDHESDPKADNDVIDDSSSKPSASTLDKLNMPMKFWLGGWGVSTVVAASVFWHLFDCSVYMLVVACLTAPLWSIGITKAVGTTGSNVASYCGKLMIIIFASWYGSKGKVVPVLVTSYLCTHTCEMLVLQALGALSTAVIDQVG